MCKSAADAAADSSDGDDVTVSECVPLLLHNVRRARVNSTSITERNSVRMTNGQAKKRRMRQKKVNRNYLRLLRAVMF